MQHNHTATKRKMATPGLLPTGEQTRKTISSNASTVGSAVHQASLSYGTDLSFPDYDFAGQEETIGSAFRKLARDHKPVSYHSFCYRIVTDLGFLDRLTIVTNLTADELVTCAKAHLILYYMNSKSVRARPAPIVPQSGYFTDPLGMKAMADVFPVGVQAIADVAKDLTGQLKDMTAKAEGMKFAHTFNHQLPQLDAIFNMFAQTLSPGPGGSKLLFGLTAVAVCGFSVRTLDRKVSHMICGIVAIYAATKYGSEFVSMVVDPIVNTYRGFMEEEPTAEVEPQMGVDATVLPLAMALLGLVHADSGQKGSGSSGAVKTFVKSLGEIPKLTSGVNLVVSWLCDAATKFCNFLASSAGYDPVIVEKSMFPELDDISKELNEIIKEFRNGAPYDYDHAQRIFELERRAAKAIVCIPSSSEFAPYKRSAMSLLSSIRPFVAKMERNNIVDNGPRREPLGIMLGGPTNVGKSTVTVPLLTAVCELVMPREKLKSFRQNRDDHIWNYIPENPFHDSYHRQYNVIMDEAGSYYDAAGTPDPGAQGVLRMINTANFPLHMASLEDKGCTNFRSELVWATTNRTFFDWKSMYLPEAYARRFKLSFLQVPKVEYCAPGTVSGDLWERRMDVRKIMEAGGDYNMAIYEFFPYDFSPNAKRRYLGESLDFDSLVLLIAGTYKKHRDQSDKLLNFHNIIQKKYSAMRDDLDLVVEDDESEADVFYETGEEPLESQSGHGGNARIWELVEKLEPHLKFSKPAMDLIRKNEHKLLSLPDNEIVGFLAGANVVAFIENVEDENMSFLASAKSFLCNHPYLLGLTAGLAAFSLIWKLVGPILDSQSGEVVAKKKSPQKPKRSTIITKAGLIKYRSPEAEIGITQNCWDLAKKVIQKSSYKAVVEGRTLGYFTFVCGRIALYPEHFSNHLESWMEDGEIEKDPIICFSRSGAPDSGFQCRWSEAEWFVVGDARDDIAYVRFPQVVPNHADISRYFLKEDEDFDNGSFDSAFLRPDGPNFGIIATKAHPHGQIEYGGYSCDGTYRYNLQTRKGDCGSPLFLLRPNGAIKFAGIHVAGNGATGYAAKVHYEVVKAIMKETSAVPGLAINEEPVAHAQIGGAFLVCEKTKAIRVPNKSRIEKSPLYGKWGPALCAPAKLQRGFNEQGDLIDPWVSARAKYCHLPKHISVSRISTVADAVNFVTNYSCDHDDPWKPRIFTFEEACEGLDGVEYFNAIPRSKSAGYPFSLDAKGPGKSDWFGAAGEFEFDSEKCIKLRARVDTLVARLGERERGNFLYSDYLKDERKPIEKAEAGRGRLISAAPLDLLILCRMYFGDYVRHCMQHKVGNSMAIGVNPYSSDWEGVYRHITCLGDNIIAGDFSGYDGRLMPAVMYHFLGGCENYYYNSSEHDRTVREMLFEEIVNSRHVAVDENGAGFIYEFFGSNPSGNPLTTLLNCYCNLVLIYMGASGVIYDDLNLSEDKHLPFHKCVDICLRNIRAMVFGDDNLIGVSDAYSSLITQASMTSAMANFGMTYTDEVKSDEQHGHRSMADCSFLKRGFKYDNHLGRHTAPLEITVVLESPYWTHRGCSEQDIKASVDACLMELSIHGRAVYNKWAGKVIQAARSEIGYTPRSEWLHHFNRSVDYDAEHK